MTDQWLSIEDFVTEKYGEAGTSDAEPGAAIVWTAPVAGWYEWRGGELRLIEPYREEKS